MAESKSRWSAARYVVPGVLAGTLLAACATPETTFRRDRKPYEFTISVDPADKKKCRVEVDFRNCDPSLPVNDPRQRKDCARVKGEQQVVFVAGADTGEFRLQFDPFGATAIRSSGGKTEALTVRRPTKAGAKKPHTFWVETETCLVDPEIIAEW